MKILTYHIELLEPTLVTALEGDPNSSVTFDFLPGSVLRGAIIGKYMQAKTSATAPFEPTVPHIRRLFFDGTTRYLNGYPLPQSTAEEPQRTLPTPLSWQHEKDKDTQLVDFAVDIPDDEDIQWQGESRPFCLCMEGGTVSLVLPKHYIAVHTARTRRFGRAMPAGDAALFNDETPGAIYRYEALAAGQMFAAAILCDHDEDAATLRACLTGHATLGGARSSGYGRVRLQEVDERTSWSEAGDGHLPEAHAGAMTVTFLSDALLRDEHGQFAVDPEVVTRALSAQLGGIALHLHRQKTFVRGREIGGFNRTWGLPLPQTLAVHMGSVLVYDPPACDPCHLQALELHGMGERRAEGFGRLAINWQQHDTWQESSAQKTLPAIVSVGEQSSRALAERMTQRLLRQQLDEYLTASANDLGTRITRPSKSQLARLRLILHDALRQEPTVGRARLTQYLQSIEERQTTRRQFTGDRVAGRALLDWLRLRFRLADEQDIWREIKVDLTKLPKVGANVAADLTGLAYEYNLRLVDAVLARAAKSKQREGV
jgi:CRISPR-associated protein Csx10